MFGMSFGELCVLLMVAMVILGPKELPRYLRKAGQIAGRLRRLAFEMREKSGIDEVLRTEGLDREIAEFRKLARGEVMGVTAAVRSLTEPPRPSSDSPDPYGTPSSAAASRDLAPPGASMAQGVVVVRERELPTEGADAYGALPDTSAVYEGMLAPSPLASDSLYTRGSEEPPATSDAEPRSEPSPAAPAQASAPSSTSPSASTPPTSA